MVKEIYINLPVKDLKRSIDFFTQLGFTFNPQFTNENATCMIMGENIYAMLLVESFFKTFTKKEIADTGRNIEAILAISTDSRDKVDTIIRRAIEAGGKTPTEKQDHGWMYSHGFEDPDGHFWEVLYMDVSAMPQE